MSPLRIQVPEGWKSTRSEWGVELRAPGDAVLSLRTWPTVAEASRQAAADPLAKDATEVAHPELRPAGLAVRATAFRTRSRDVLHAVLEHGKDGPWIARFEGAHGGAAALDQARSALVSVRYVDALNATIDDDEVLVPDPETT